MSEASLHFGLQKVQKVNFVVAFIYVLRSTTEAEECFLALVSGWEGSSN